MRNRPPLAAVVAARDLTRALEQVPDQRAGRQAIPVVPLPPVGVGGSAEEQGGVGHPTGDHDVGAVFEGLDDRACAQVGRREQRLAGKVVERRTRLRVRE
jgi:hypothetical protein